MSPYLFILAVLLPGCLFVLSCENSQKEVDELFGKRLAIEVADSVNSYLSQDGKIKARLTSPYMVRQVTDSNYMEFPRTLHVDFYDDSAKIETILDAKYAKYREYESKVLLRDSVRVINIKNGDTLRTPELWWDQNKQEFYTDKPSHISKRDGTVIFSKQGMKAKQDLSWYELYQNSGQLPVPEDANPNPAADSLQTSPTQLQQPTTAPGNKPGTPPPTPPVQPANPAVKPGPFQLKQAPGTVPVVPNAARLSRTDSMRLEREKMIKKTTQQ